MKKSNYLLLFLWFLIFPFTLFSQIKDIPSEKTILNENSPLECSRCNPRSHNPPPCLNCLMEGKIRLKDNSILEGKIIAVKGKLARIKIPYGGMDIGVDSILLPESQPSSPPLPKTSSAVQKVLKTLQGGASPPASSSPIIPKDKTAFRKPDHRSEKKDIKQPPSSLKNMLKQTQWISYMPSTYNPDAEDKLNPEDIRKDLPVLRSAGFNGLITYSSGGVMAQIPSLAKEAGFTHILMGIWDPRNKSEIENAVKAASLVDGYCIGHEGLFRKEYSKQELIQGMKEVREKTGKPVTTSDNMTVIRSAQNRDLLEACDWIFLIAYFMFDENLKKKTPEKGLKWIRDMGKNTETELHLKKPVMFKEIGFPTAGEEWANEKNQEKFLKGIVRSNLIFALFEAFDQPWKTDSELSPNWGLFKQDRSPKKYAQSRMKKIIPA